MKISDFERFKLNHNERQILPYEKILNKYPSLQIYGFKSAVKQCFEDFDIPEITHYDLYECGNDLSEEDWEKLFDTPINECPYKKDHKFSKSFWYPPFLPDLHFVSENLILCIEVEDYARITEERSLIGVFDMHKKAYRFINVKTLEQLKVKGITYTIKEIE